MEMKRTGIPLFLLLSLGCLLSGSPLSAERKNVLFIMADDFNHWLPAIGYDDQAITPNLDRLAAKGVLFADAQSASPVCNPSRNALWSGLRPETTGIKSNADGFVRDKPGFEHIVSLHQYFMQQGYHTVGAGKLWHPGRMGVANTDAEHWSELYTGRTGSPGGSYSRYNPDFKSYQWSGGEFDLETDANDTVMAHHIAKLIGNYSKSKQADQPFFIATGFFRPHLPWHCHKAFWDLYDRSKLKIPQGYKAGDLEDIPTAVNNTEAHDIIHGDGKWIEGIHAYLANLSYADYNVGILLDALDKSPHRDNTIVLFMGDHGWHLGEKERWSKHEVFDQANHTTLIIYDPSAAGNGQVCHKVVSLQDVYPTLVSLCGLPEREMVQGNDLTPLLHEPALASWDKPVFMSWNERQYIKSDDWKFIEDGEKSQLYHVAVDPYEWDNLFGKPGYEQVTVEMRNEMKRQIEGCTRLRERITAN